MKKSALTLTLLFLALFSSFLSRSLHAQSCAGPDYTDMGSCDFTVARDKNTLTTASCGDEGYMEGNDNLMILWPGKDRNIIKRFRPELDYDGDGDLCNDDPAADYPHLHIGMWIDDVTAWYGSPTEGFPMNLSSRAAFYQFKAHIESTGGGASCIYDENACDDGGAITTDPAIPAAEQCPASFYGGLPACTGTPKNKKVKGKCSNNKYQCRAGAPINKSGNTWTCQGMNGGSDSRQCRVTSKVDGQCDNTAYGKCLKGTPDTARGRIDQWRCNGNNGGRKSPLCDVPDIDAVCGPDLATKCLAGTARHTPGQTVWSCKGKHGGTDVRCDANPKPGQCGPAFNECINPVTHTPDNTLLTPLNPPHWQCKGVNGGTTTNCQHTGPVNAVCGSAVNTCKPGSPFNTLPGPPPTWTCKGINGGKKADCGTPVNGQCDTVNEYHCIAGTVANKDTRAKTWDCLGKNGGVDYHGCKIKGTGNTDPPAQCGTTHLTCVHGYPSFLSTTLWQCGPTATLQYPSSQLCDGSGNPTSGQCGSAAHTCAQGHPLANTLKPGSPWQCLGVHGGADANCPKQCTNGESYCSAYTRYLCRNQQWEIIAHGPNACFTP